MTTINEKKIRKIVREEISEVTKEGLKIGTHSIYITPNSINMDGNLIGKVGSVIFGNSGVQDASITRAGPYSLQVANDLAVSGVVSSNTVNTNFMHSTSMQVDGSLGISTLYVENMNVNNILSVRTSGFTTNIYSYDEGTIFINNTILSSGYYTGTGNIKTTFGTLIVGSDTLGTTIATNLINEWR